MAKLINKIVSGFIKMRYQEIDYARSHAQQVQEKWFDYLVRKAEQTEFGKRYNFEKIQTIDQFKASVPISNYEEMEPYILRMMEDEQNLIWPSTVKWFAKSSGTTSSKSKFIPVSKESLEDCHYDGGKDMLALYCHEHPNTHIFSGKGLVLGGSTEVNDNGDNSYFGDLSAVIIRNLPFWVEYQRSPSREVALMSNWEEKLEKMAQECAYQDITSMTGVPSWTLVLLKRVLEIREADKILDVWPNLELFMHGGVSFEPYRQQYEEIIGGDIVYMESYNASEGFFAIQDRFDYSGQASMTLMCDYGVFFEFMPLSELGKEKPTTLSLEEVEPEVSYALVISTNAGLWRYMIGDTIKFTELNPYRIQITGRTKHYINAFGEELMIENVQKALEKACGTTGAFVTDFTGGPVFMSGTDTGGHEWLMEFDKEPDDWKRFVDLFDEGLKEVNSDYEAKRFNDYVLAYPKVTKLENGTFYNWLKNKNKLGGQNKVPRLSNNRTYLDEILDFIGQPVDS